jgi:hypothetical protein
MQPMMRLLRKMRPALLRAADLIVMKMKAIRQRMIAMMKAVMKKMGPLREKYPRPVRMDGTWHMG